MKNFFKTLGPGILFASTAIGVSHLIQCTRAGADYGMALIWAVVVANLFKYPFFEYASRYANVTKTSIIDGYLTLGKWMLWTYFIITILTMFFVTSAVAVVTTGFFDNLLGVSETLQAMGIQNTKLVMPILTFVVCGGILFLGKFGLLDSITKITGAVLLISTLIAYILVLFKGAQQPIESFIAPNAWDFSNPATFGFIIALMGWMPTAMDLSAWNSLWTLERIKQTKYQPSLKETQIDFLIGYTLSAILAICFITLGAYILFGSGKNLEDNPVKFAHQVVILFTQSMGNWSYILIAASSFTIMFGTLIAVLDGYSRSLERTWTLLNHKTKKATSQKKAFNTSLIILTSVSFIIMYFFVYAPNSKPQGFKNLVDFATSASFIFAPIIAVVNYKLVSNHNFPKKHQPKLFLKTLSIIGIIFLILFSLIKLYYIFTNG